MNCRYIAPTLIENPPLDSPIMAEEIFGPLLPIITVRIPRSKKLRLTLELSRPLFGVERLSVMKINCKF